MVALRFRRVNTCRIFKKKLFPVEPLMPDVAYWRTVDEPHIIKDLFWIGSLRKDLKAFPDEVQDVVGYALYAAQRGQKASEAKVLTGFGGAGVLEIVDDHGTDTYRAVYTVKFSDLVYVLHVFQKKFKKGNATPKADMKLVKHRLKAAEEDYANRQSRTGIKR